MGEVVGHPRGAPGKLAVLLALPNNELARRLHEGLSKPPQRSTPAPVPVLTDGVGLPALRCELEMLAKIDLVPGGPSENAAAVVHRGICDACNVSLHRVRILGVREGRGGVI